MKFHLFQIFFGCAFRKIAWPDLFNNKQLNRIFYYNKHHYRHEGRNACLKTSLCVFAKPKVFRQAFCHQKPTWDGNLFLLWRINYSGFNYFDTRQQAEDSTSRTARRSNAVAKVKLIRYIFRYKAEAADNTSRTNPVLPPFERLAKSFS